MSNGTDVEWARLVANGTKVQETEWFPSTWTPADVNQQGQDWRIINRLPDEPFDQLTQVLEMTETINPASVEYQNKARNKTPEEQGNTDQAIANQVERDECFAILADPTQMSVQSLDKVVRMLGTDMWGVPNTNT